MADKPNAQARLQFLLGSAIFDRELMQDRIDALTAQLAERDATIEQLLQVMKPAGGGENDIPINN